MWLIWSNVHQAWWKGGSMGYTIYKSKAGRYTFKEAIEYLKLANLFTYDQTRPNETLFYEEDTLEDSTWGTGTIG